MTKILTRVWAASLAVISFLVSPTVLAQCEFPVDMARIMDELSVGFSRPHNQGQYDIAKVADGIPRRGFINSEGGDIGGVHCDSDHIYSYLWFGSSVSTAGGTDQERIDSVNALRARIEVEFSMDGSPMNPANIIETSAQDGFHPIDGHPMAFLFVGIVSEPGDLAPGPHQLALDYTFDDAEQEPLVVNFEVISSTTPVTEELLSFSYDFHGLDSRPWSVGARLEGEAMGFLDPTDSTGNRVVITEILNARLIRSASGLPVYEYETSNGALNSIAGGGGLTTPTETAKMSFTGTDNNFRYCHRGFTYPPAPDIPIDCGFGAPGEGGFGYTNNIGNAVGGWVSAADGDTPAGTCIEDRGEGWEPIEDRYRDWAGCRASDFPYDPGNWTLLVNPDLDDDGIANEIDTMRLIPSAGFDDGNTSGAITNPGDQVLSVTDESDPAGIRIVADAGGGLEAATVDVCNGDATLTINASDDTAVTCTSVQIIVFAGEVEMAVVVNGQPAIVTVPANNELTYQPETSTFTAPPSNPDPVVVSIAGSEVTVGPGETFDVEPFRRFSAELEIDDDEFELSGDFRLGAGTDGINPKKEDVTITVGGMSWTIPSGSFDKDGGDFEFEGQIDGVDLDVEIERIGGKRYEFEIEAETDIVEGPGPVEISFLIGNDTGTTHAVPDDDDD